MEDDKVDINIFKMDDVIIYTILIDGMTGKYLSFMKDEPLIQYVSYSSMDSSILGVIRQIVSTGSRKSLDKQV